jgi:hypothetical protein
MSSSLVVLIGFIFCGIILLVSVGFGIFILLVKLGVIVREAQRPPHQDTGVYTLNQGHEVRAEDQQSQPPIERS